MHQRYLIFLLFMLGLNQAALAGLNIDTIWFQDGDRITGEVLDLRYNELKFDTDDAGVMKIEWKTVDKVMILNTMRIVLDDGTILYGQIHLGTEEGTGTIQPIGGGLPMWVYLVRIVSMTSVEERFVERLSGLFSSGFSYVKATEVMQLALSADLTYEAAKNHFNLFYSGILSDDPVQGYNERQKGGANYKRYLPSKWFIIGQWSMETNSELQLDLRTGMEISGGKSIVMTNEMRFEAGLGIMGSREQSVDLSAYNLEGVLTLDYSIFIFDAPDISFSLHGNLIPSLNDPGRVRTELESSMRWEVFNDFYLKWSFYHSFDSRPLSEDASKTDWSITMLGLEYQLK